MKSMKDRLGGPLCIVQKVWVRKARVTLSTRRYWVKAIFLAVRSQIGADFVRLYAWE